MSQDWLVTPLIALQANTLLSFVSRTTLAGDNGTIYKIMASTTSQTDHSTFVPIATYTETQLSTMFGMYEQTVIPMPDYSLQNVYIAFVREFTQPGAATAGDRWLIDNVKVDSGFFNTISGTVTMADSQTDCDTPSATPVHNIAVMATSGSNGAIIHTNEGQYSFSMIGDLISVSPDVNPLYFDITPASAELSISATQDEPIIANFCIVPGAASHYDVATSIAPVGNARPGFDCSYRIVVKNNGNRITSGSLMLNFDGTILDYVSSGSAVSGQTANSVSWNFTDLQIFESRAFTVTLNLNSPLEIPAVNLGDILSFDATAMPVDSDENLADNTATLEQTVVNSLDPNDKLVAEGAFITPDQTADYLHYTIRFQNMGTAAATVVRIVDEIESDLDITTLHVESASHNFSADIRENRVAFLFNDINLPAASVDEPGSHGYVSFRIKPLSTVGLGDAIENSAQIFFDFNAPILTNTALTTVALLGTPSFGPDNAFTLYPNPVSSVLYIQSANKIESVDVYNNVGQTVLAARDADAIDVSKFPSGVYFVRVMSATASDVHKFVKR